MVARFFPLMTALIFVLIGGAGCGRKAVEPGRAEPANATAPGPLVSVPPVDPRPVKPVPVNPMPVKPVPVDPMPVVQPVSRPVERGPAPGSGQTLYGVERLTLGPVPDYLRAVAFSPDGRLLITTSAAPGIGVWDLATGRLARTLEGHAGGVTKVVFSADGKLLASASNDRTVRLWSMPAGEPLRVLQNEQGFEMLAFADGGKCLLTQDYRRVITLWDVTTGSVRKVIAQGGAGAKDLLAVSPDGQTAATGREADILLLDTLTGNVRSTLRGHTRSIYGAAFSADGKTLISTGRDDKFILVWDVPSGTVRKKVETNDSLGRMVLSPGATALATMGHQVDLWDPATGKKGVSLWWKGMSIENLAFSPDGNALAIADRGSRTVRIVDLEWTREKLVIPNEKSDIVATACFPGTGAVATAGHNRPIEIWKGGAAAAQQIEAAISCRLLAVSPDGAVLAARVEDAVQLYDVAEGKLRTRFLTGVRPAIEGRDCLAFSPDGKRLAVGADAGVEVWDAAGKKRWTNLVLPGKMVSLAWEPDSKRLATGMADGRVMVWDVLAADPPRVLRGPVGAMGALTFSPDGKFVAAADTSERTVWLWDSATGEEHFTLEHAAKVDAVGFSADGKTLIALVDGTICLWNPATGQATAVLRIAGTTPHTLDFSPNRKTVATRSYREIRLWDVDAILQPLNSARTDIARTDSSIPAKEIGFAPVLRTFDAARDGQAVLAVSRDGTLLAAGGDDKEIP
jgi:WD40 repeat protein